MIGPIEDSDKHYWHRYVEFYRDELASFHCQSVLEFGVWRGASIRWLMELFPTAEIYGVDILDVQSSWPQEDRIKYFRADQADIAQIRSVCASIDHGLDLVIEDGSHLPLHQCNCLVATIPYIRPGGIFILEDIHTSHPNHPWFRKSKRLFASLIGPLHLLLAIDHLKTFGIAGDDKFSALSVNSLFTSNDVMMLREKIESVKIFKRTKLPYRCFACGGSNFEYAALKCECGASLYADTDSMTALIRIR